MPQYRGMVGGVGEWVSSLIEAGVGGNGIRGFWRKNREGG